MLAKSPLDGRRRSLSPDVAIVCFSHLRWNFVYQRPQHLMSRFARERAVYFIEEPDECNDGLPFRAYTSDEGVVVVTPSVAAGRAVDDVFKRFGICEFVAWYYTPAALEFSTHLRPRATVYDCMDQLSAFKNADPRLPELETLLLRRADVVFCGGRSLYEQKRRFHGNVHALPSSVDRVHFKAARSILDEREEQRDLARPRAGYYGVIDERLDIELLGRLASLLPDWNFVIVGPVVKIDPGSLPVRSNIRYVGHRPYESLPGFLAGWDVAIQPFARNAATEFISPTKTLEYLAAGKRVVSTSIRDVVEPYGRTGLVEIADDPPAFAAALDRLRGSERDVAWLAAVDRMLQGTSWERTWETMDEAIAEVAVA
ncbi:MAG: glycosyltransferase [Candidatus Eremiobacteraeota bacterium]|nr:glycosyltransferase [Candidatus Eremiobacteraeota bacterium]